MEIIYLQKFLKSIQRIKSESGLELEPKELRDLNTSIKSIETKWIEEERTLSELFW